MEYRRLPHGNELISTIGFGTSYIGGAPEGETEATFELAFEKGINYVDLASGHAETFPRLGNVLPAVRDKVYLQVHFGADYSSGKYGWTTDLEAIKRSVDWNLKNLKTDYIDFGFIHCLDEHKDLDDYLASGALEYIKELQAQGVVRRIGMSSHTPELVNRVLDMMPLDMLMFSINPAYDYKKGTYGIGSVDERMSLYRRCEKEGVGISVMKSFSGGQLLDEKTSPFGKALTRSQCIQYALDKPGVLTVLPGYRNREDLLDVLRFNEQSAEEKDYSVIGTFAPQDANGVCVYCNHCAPCPIGLDVALINKYYDLSKAGDDMARVHYKSLELKAENCVGCGHCNSRCPFGVDQVERMQEIREYFGE